MPESCQTLPPPASREAPSSLPGGQSQPPGTPADVDEAILASREAVLASREAVLASREAILASREAVFASREAVLASREAI